MSHGNSSVERQHRAIQSESAPISLRGKFCACGGKVTARQLTQHGKCNTCVLTAEITPDDLAKLQHMLGAVPGWHLKSQWGFRNHYCCGVQDRESMERLVAAGLARAGDLLLTSRNYHATALGCRAAGLGAAATRRALGDHP